LDKIGITEFGIGLEDDEGVQQFCCMTIDSDIQSALQEMTIATWSAMNKLDRDPPLYDPSNKHESPEYVHLPIDDELATQLRLLHFANNLPINSNALADPDKVLCYFARLTDAEGRRLTALRRATHFKGVLKNRMILLQLITNALQLIEEKVFRLDNDFDLLVDSTTLHIFRPNSFEFLGRLREALLAAVPDNIREIEGDLTFVDFTHVQDYAMKHTRAARYLASIRSQKLTENINESALKETCTEQGVNFTEVDGMVVVQDGHIMGFLEVLDRRRYRVNLVEDSPERYKATARRKIK